MEEQNKKLEAIMKRFSELSYEEKREKVIRIVEGLGESDIYSTSLDILKNYNPQEEYMANIYKIIMRAKLEVIEEGKEQEKLDAQKKMQDYIHKLNELSVKQKEQDEQEAEDILSTIDS